MIVVFWIFILWLVFGECGGYKTIIRKPTKKRRHNVIKTVVIGSMIFFTGMIGSLIYSY